MTFRDAPARLAVMSRPVFHFSAFELDPALRELRRDDRAVGLSPMLFDALVWLVTHRDRAIGRDELMAAVWGRADVTDAQLAQLVRKLRRVLSDDGDAQGMIRTVPRFGFRWVAETRERGRDTDAVATRAPPSFPAVEERGDERPEEPVPDTTVRPGGAVAWVEAVQPVEAGRRQWRRLPVAATLLVLAGLAALVAFRMLQPGEAARSEPARAAHGASGVVAVLPAEVDAATGADWRWLRMGLMDLMAHRLRQGGLFVTPSDNVVAALHDGAEGDAQRHLLEATGARSVLALSVRRTGDGWVVGGRWREPAEPVREFEAHAGDPTAAARQLGDRVLRWLGRAPVGDDDASAAPDAWLQRIDAAMLDSDYTVARELLLQAPRALRESPLLHLREGDLLAATDRVDAAATAYQAVLDALPPEHGDGLVRGSALIGSAGVLAQQGRIEPAIARLGEAVALLQERNAPALLGEALYERAVLEMAQGRLDEAESDFAQARVAFELGSDSLRLARLDAQQATLISLRQRHAEALALLQRATLRFERFGASALVVDALGNAAVEQLALLRPAAAQAAIDGAEAWLPKLDQPITRAIHEYHAVRVLVANGRFGEAGMRLDRVIDTDADVQVLGYAAALRAEAARLELARGEPARAAAQFRDAMPGLLSPSLDSVLYGRLRGAAWLGYVRALERSGQAGPAHAESAKFAAAAGDDPVMSLLAGLAEAESSRHAGRPGEAIRRYEAMLREANRRGAPADIAAIGVSYGDMLLDVGELARATTVVGLLGGWAAEDFDCARVQARLYRALGQPEAAVRAEAQMRALAGERRVPTTDTASGKASGR